MILADTSVWIDHFRSTNAQLAREVDLDRILIHPFVIGELAMGHLARREKTLTQLSKLTIVSLASYDEVRGLVETRKLYGRGIGMIDAHLLASAYLHPACKLWTLDLRLQAVARELGMETGPLLH